MKKILHIPNYYPPHVGGIEDVCHSIVSAMKESFEQKVLCFNDQSKTIREIQDGVEVIRIGSLAKLRSQSLAPSYLSILKKTLKEFKPDIIHFHTPNPFAGTAFLFTLPKDIKLIVHWHSDIIEQKKLYAFYKPLERKILKRANVILTTSPIYYTESQALKPWKNKIQVLPNVVQTERFNLSDQEEQGVEEIKRQYQGRPIIFFLGRHVPYKGLEFLLKSEQYIHNNAIIIVAGQGTLTKKLKSVYCSNRITFIGKISNTLLKQYLHASDIFAFPSITKNEAFGIALAEAMYCGLPAVTFTIPGSGVNWVNINNETGIEVENGNFMDYANAINILLDNSELRLRYGYNAHKRVKEFFTMEAIYEALMNLYA